MADKLAESTWTAFTKKQSLKLEDAALVKALARFDRTELSKPGPHTEALDEVVAQIDKQLVSLAKRKKELGDKPFALAKDKLHDLRELAEAQQKLARAAASESADEEDSPLLLTTKMVPLVRELRKGQARMPALISTAGKETAVLVMRRAISPTRRKLMSDYLDAQGGVKHITGECVFEKGALTFVVASPAAGLAKRVRAALLRQLELRLKVRVRGEDGAEDEDGEDAGEEQGGVAQTGVPPAPPGRVASAAELAYTQRLLKLKQRLEQALRDQHPQASTLRAVSGFASEKAAAEDFAGATKALQMLEQLLDAPAPADSPAVDAGAAFKARLAALIPRIKQAQAQGHPAAQDVRLLASEASTMAAKKDFGAAQALLDRLEGLLGGPSPSQERPQADTPQPPQPPVTGQSRGIAWPKLLLRWREAQGQSRAAVEALGRAILTRPDVRRDPRFTKVQQAVARLPTLIPDLGGTLEDLLDRGLNAGTDAEISQEARRLIAQYRRQLAGATTLGRLEQFAKTHVSELKVLGTLDSALAEIAERLE